VATEHNPWWLWLALTVIILLVIIVPAIIGLMTGCPGCKVIP
jgi:hypothetical protein